MSKLTYDEATKEIKKLSTDFDLDENHEFEVIYKGVVVAIVNSRNPYELYTNVDNFYGLPFSDKLWMILSDLAMTPIDKRVLVHKWQVPIIITESYKVIWSKIDIPERGEGAFGTQAEPFSLTTLFNYTGKSTGTKDDYIFTDSEYKELLDYLQTLPEGKYQVEMAERGKVEVFI